MLSSFLQKDAKKTAIKFSRLAKRYVPSVNHA